LVVVSRLGRAPTVPDHSCAKMVGIETSSSSPPRYATLNYISRRVTLSGATGALAGALVALHRGHDSVGRTAARTALSCALVGTACFSAERLVYLGVQRYLMKESDMLAASDESRRKEEYYLKLYSHCIGGVLSGAFLGHLYTKKAVRGSLFFAPLMLGIAVVEEKVKETVVYYQQQEQQRLLGNPASQENRGPFIPQNDMNKRN
jgi:F0F1-type ATP synthase assembly protein I